ncbi:serine hydrolase [Cohnella sp. GbtcB17]|uniref:serine hydrolase n=1 Tax=Cohnella sp. GbtcB17 TaxID=2824762 RepID=UPI001C2FB069|nr:serine hydrolase [Cohnella sp. GbtcB17]
MMTKKTSMIKITLFASLLTASFFPGIRPTSAFASGESPNLTEISGVVQPIIDEAWKDGVRVSVGIEDLGGAYGNDGVLLGRDDTYKPASTIKMALVSTLMQQVDDGILKLSDTVTVKPTDVVGGTGSLQKETFPQDVTLDRLARLMITQSDNTATNVLIDVVGLDKVQALLDNLDLKVMHLGRKMFASAPTPEQDNYINAKDLATLLKDIYDGTFLTAESRNRIIAWMGAQEVNTKFGAALPEAPIAHKTGENANVTHDVGYFLLPGRELAISVMTEVTTTDDFDEAQAIGNPVVQQVAKAVYNQMLEDNEANAGKPMTRAEFTSMLARELGLKMAAGQGKAFADVGTDSPYYAEIMAAREAGIVNGLSGSSFAGDSIISRAEMTTMFIRA